MSKHRVLVIDDDKLVADTLSLIFIANGYDSEARYSAAQGLDRARSFAPQLVLCDVTMPEGTGLEVAETMDREMPETQMLMLTGFSTNADKVEAESCRLGRPLKLLSKPCRPEELLAEASRMLKTA